MIERARRGPATRRSCSPSTPPCSAAASATCAAASRCRRRSGRRHVARRRAAPRRGRWRSLRSEPIRFANVVGRDGRRRRIAGHPRRLHQLPVRPGPVVGRRRLAALGLGRADRRSRASRPSTTRCSPPTRASTPSSCRTTAAASSTAPRPPFSLVAPVADAVGGRTEIICDGGVRRGSDIVKAVAAGATACMAGRAYLYALGAGGERGVDTPARAGGATTCAAP